MTRTRLIVGFLSGITLAFSQASTTFAKAVLSISEIQQTAQPLTVQVLGFSKDGSQTGSGVIIAKQGNTYAVLTNRHVICNLDLAGQCDRTLKIQIRTANGQRYPIVNTHTFEQPKGIPDVAVVLFQSLQNYPVATLGDSTQLASRELIWINGYPGNPKQSPGTEPVAFHKGFFTSEVNDPHREGYSLMFTTIAAPGMSGSPIFDASGRVIAIFGQSGDMGLLAGIPTNFVSELIQQSPKLTTLPLNVDRSAVTGTRPQLSTPQTAEDYFLRGVSQIEQPQAALADLTKAIELNPNLMMPYRTRAALLARMGDRAGAMRDFDAVLRLNPDRSDALSSRALMRAKWNDLKGAISDYTEALRLAPQTPSLLFNRGMTHSRLGNYQASVNDFTAGIALQPKDAVAYRERGRSYLGLQQLPNALKDFDRSIALDPNSAVTYDLRCFVQLGMDRYQAAMSDCTRAIEINPNFAIAYADRAFAWLGLNNPQNAIKDANKAIQLDPKLSESYTVQAMAYERMGDLRNAIVAYESVMNLLRENGQINSKAYQGISATIAQLRKGKITRISLERFLYGRLAVLD
ncbi:MAG: trypsin-like peptidase domain-containing protein [Leptolyngbya sp. Prado105]|jgi:tetratricopeptide (TPR) repeat protein|nr:trypsin-like peptidase domain-containing protein [Leptolyngbya sp. Prado105]